MEVWLSKQGSKSGVRPTTMTNCLFCVRGKLGKYGTPVVGDDNSWPMLRKSETFEK